MSGNSDEQTPIGGGSSDEAWWTDSQSEPGAASPLAGGGANSPVAPSPAPPAPADPSKGATSAVEQRVRKPLLLGVAAVLLVALIIGAIVLLKGDPETPKADTGRSTTEPEKVGLGRYMNEICTAAGTAAVEHSNTLDRVYNLELDLNGEAGLEAVDAFQAQAEVIGQLNRKFQLDTSDGAAFRKDLDESSKLMLAAAKDARSAINDLVQKGDDDAQSVFNEMGKLAMGGTSGPAMNALLPMLNLEAFDRSEASAHVVHQLWQNLEIEPACAGLQSLEEAAAAELEED